MYGISDRLYQPLLESYTIRENYLMSDNMHTNLGVHKLEFLKLQYKVVGKFKEHHKELGRVYYTNYYTFTVILTVATILTALLISIIANKGWEKADPLLRVAFFSLFAISMFFGIMTVALNQKDNYESNFHQYLYFDKVQNNIITFVNTSDKYDSAHATNLADSFIVAVNNDLRTNSQFFISIDANKISFDEISSKLGKAVNGKTN
jgi:hypothetical protein